MKFRLVFYTNQEIDTALMQDLSNMIEIFLLDKYYGDNILNYYIGIICVDPKFDQFFKPRRPKYTGEMKTSIRDGIKCETEKTLQIDIKLDYEHYLKLDIVSAKKYLIKRILESFIELKQNKRINKLDFDFELFYNDLMGFVESKGLL